MAALDVLVFDRLPEFDERSRAYPIRALLSSEQLEAPARSYTWSVPVSLDQGTEGACVGFAWAHEVAARPAANPRISGAYARAIYHRARQLDQWAGEGYEGTSVIAGAKATTELAELAEYRWAFGLDDLARAVAYKGPAVLGLNWYTGMLAPDSEGRIRPTGQIEGGHAILLPRVTGERYRVAGARRRLYVYNSWGRRGGWPWAWLSWDDAERLLHEDGEACIPVRRRTRSGGR